MCLGGVVIYYPLIHINEPRSHSCGLSCLRRCCPYCDALWSLSAFWEPILYWQLNSQETAPIFQTASWITKRLSRSFESLLSAVMKIKALALSLFTLATALSLQGPIMKVSLSLPLLQLIHFFTLWTAFQWTVTVNLALKQSYGLEKKLLLSRLLDKLWLTPTEHF